MFLMKTYRNFLFQRKKELALTRIQSSYISKIKEEKCLEKFLYLTNAQNVGSKQVLNKSL